mgnify:CR=1 FL=1
MAIRINNSANFSQKQLLNIDNKLKTTINRLASGKRITKAADDASGLVLSDSLRSQRLGLGQSMRNATEAISIVQTADGALEEASRIIHDIRKKAVQAGSDIHSVESRQALQADIDRSLAALNRIADTTSYNGRKLLSGNFSNKSFQIGDSPGQSLTISIGSVAPDRLGTGLNARAAAAPSQTTLQLTANLETADDIATDHASIIAGGSVLAAGSTFNTGSTTGFVLEDANLQADIATTGQSDIRAGSVLGAGSVIAAGSELGGTVTAATDITTAGTSDMHSGSILTAGTILAAGTEVTTTFKADGNTYQGGTTLLHNVTLTQGITLTETLSAGSGSRFAAGSSLAAGSQIGGNVTVSGPATLDYGMTLEAGSTITAGGGTSIRDGSIIGGAFTLSADTTASRDFSAEAGSTLAAGSELAGGSTVGGRLTTAGPATLSAVMTLAAGTNLAGGTVIAAGTALTDDIRVTGGHILTAGTVLDTDVVTEGNNFLDRAMTMGEGSKLAIGTELSSSPVIADATHSGSATVPPQGSLASIDVTTADGAQDAIGIADAALAGINRERANLGSTQNQLRSTIANLAATSVNIASAESTIADLDFAEESMMLSQMKILQQARTFAQTQGANLNKGRILSLIT